MSPAPGRRHQLILGELHGRIYNLLKADPTGVAVLAPCDVRLSQYDLVQPDLIYIRNDQAERFSEHGFDGAPALVIEVISPSTGSYDRGRKAALYMNSGVEEYWIVDPMKQHVLVHTSAEFNAIPKIVTGGVLSSIVLPKLSIKLSELFTV